MLFEDPPFVRSLPTWSWALLLPKNADPENRRMRILESYFLKCFYALQPEAGVPDPEIPLIRI
jgi:hypothetical protein